MLGRLNIVLFLSFSLIIGLFSCQKEREELPLNNQDLLLITALPLNVDEPSQNLTTPAKLSLGQSLFWDPILSGEKDVSCATCHHPSMGYTDGIDLSIGVGGNGLGVNRLDGTIGFAKRNSPTIVNTVFNGVNNVGTVQPDMAPMFWDNRLQSLEAQAIEPILSFEEMRGPNFSEDEILVEIVNRISDNDVYKYMFNNAFGDDEITISRIGKAIAVFERSLISNNSPFDRYKRGELNAMSDMQLRGMNTFVNVGCIECHKGPMLSDYQLHVMGIRDNNKLNISDAGAGSYKFRTPSLRNLSLTAPYMHNGEFNSLDRVLRFYDQNNRESMNANVNNNDLDDKLRNLRRVGPRERDEIIAFLSTLNDDSFDKTILSSVPSGLNPGGNID